ncbi:MAG: hypothetical protein AAB442_01440 [Patescibacteria group bacterium]
MSEEFPSQGPQDDKERATTTLAKRLQSMLDRYVREMPPDTDRETQKKVMVARLAEVGQSLFPDIQEEYADFITSVLETQFETDADLTNEVAQRFATFALRSNSPEEFEKKLRIHNAERSGWIPINEALSYELENETHINLHIPATFTKRPLEWSALFRHGLQELARCLVTDPTLQSVQELSGHSWIIFEQPKLAERFGFTVSDRNPSKHKALASISKSKFLELYGP